MDLSLRDAAELYLSNLEAEGYVRPVTLRGYRYKINRFLTDIDLPELCRELNARHAIEWTKALRARGLKSKSVRSYQAEVWPWFGWLYRQGYTPLEISRQVRMARVDESTITRRTATPDIIDKLLTVAAARWEAPKRARALILMLVATGARRTELAACHLEDYDEEAGTLHLHRHTKTGEERWVGVDREARHAMLEYTKLERTTKPGPLFMARMGRAMTADGMGKALQSLARGAGVECSSHDFRRACAARMLAAGAQTDVVQYQLGHKTAYLTLQYGATARRDRSLAAYREIDAGVRPMRRAQ